MMNGMCCVYQMNEEKELRTAMRRDIREEWKLQREIEARERQQYEQEIERLRMEAMEVERLRVAALQQRHQLLTTMASSTSRKSNSKNSNRDHIRRVRTHCCEWSSNYASGAASSDFKTYYKQSDYPTHEVLPLLFDEALDFDDEANPQEASD